MGRNEMLELPFGSGGVDQPAGSPAVRCSQDELGNTVWFFFTHAIRVNESGREPMFCLKDCMVANGLNPNGAAHFGRAGESLDGQKGSSVFRTKGGPQRFLTVTEHGFYVLTMRGRRQSSGEFRAWLAEVAATIRRTGRYDVAAAPVPTAAVPAVAAPVAGPEQDRPGSRDIAGPGRPTAPAGTAVALADFAANLHAAAVAQAQAADVFAGQMAILRDHAAALKDFAGLLQHHDERLTRHHARLRVIEDRIDELARDIAEVPRAAPAATMANPALPPPPAPVLTDRMRLNWHIRIYCVANRRDYEETWNQFYTEVRYRLGFDAKVRAKNQGLLPIDCLDHAKLLPQAYAIAKEIFFVPDVRLNPS